VILIDLRQFSASQEKQNRGSWCRFDSHDLTLRWISEFLGAEKRREEKRRKEGIEAIGCCFGF
jgi:energy-converting hydrogenase A subunit M